MNKTNLGIRHGDVELYPIKTLPRGLREIKVNGSYVLALGSTTGHQHVLNSKGLKVYQGKVDKIFLKLKETGFATHEEHKKLSVLAGIYEVGHEQEFDWFSKTKRQVVD